MIYRSKNNPRNVLIRAPNWIGDQVIAYPFYYFLRRAFPTARIRTVCVPWVASIQYSDLVNEVTVIDVPKTRNLRARLEATEKAAAELRSSGPWDLGISLPNSLSAAWLLFRSGCKVRRGYPGDGRALLLTDRVSGACSSEVMHRAQAYMNLLPEVAKPGVPADLFWGIPPENDLDPGVPGVTTFDPLTSWPDAIPLVPPMGDYWCLAPGSVAESRRWSVEGFADLADRIIHERGWPVLIVGGAAESTLAEQIKSKVSHPEKVIDQAGKGSAVSAFAQIFRNARFTVSNDSGLAHVASLCGSPVHVVWGAGNPNRTAPIGPGKTKLTLNPVDCWPCERNTCDREQGAIECLRLIQPETVWEEIKRGLRI
ncbi:MAG: hypothetical protein A2X94_01305 [Bdellovibrionales bacterium GWB1_55_8]|nr:MAG: hypothetical protein A2X94_01305 [Bdellovibrionales bacterium GWB1_55_8]